MSAIYFVAAQVPLRGHTGICSPLTTDLGDSLSEAVINRAVLKWKHLPKGGELGDML